MKKIDDKQMIECLVKNVQERLDAMNNNYDYIESELIEYYIYEMKALSLKYDYLIKELKKL